MAFLAFLQFVLVLCRLNKISVTCFAQKYLWDTL